MSSLTFEITTAVSTLTGDVDYFELPGGGDFVPDITNPNPAQIHDDQAFEVHLHNLNQTGAMWAVWSAAPPFPTNTHFRFRVYFEEIGSGEGPIYKEHLFKIEPGNPHLYPTQTITVPAGYLNVAMYKMFAELKVIDITGKSPVAGAGELTPAGLNGKVLQIIDA